MGDGDYSVDTAREAAARDELGSWVRRFLASPGSDNPALAEKLGRETGWWHGPVLLPLDQLHRLAGPSDAPALVVVEDDDWPERVEDMEHRVEREGWEPPPVIVTYRDGQLVLEDGNHRVESLRRAGLDEAWAVVRFEAAEDRDDFVSGRSAT